MLNNTTISKKHKNKTKFTYIHIYLLIMDFILPKKQSVTFVTSFFYIYEREYDAKKTIPWRIERFREIASTGINICVYVCPTLEKYIKELEAEFPDNVRLMKTMEIRDTIISNFLDENGEYTLPEKRSDTKDLAGYLTVINSKTEFMTHAIQENPWNSTHFAWIDFNISHVFFDKERSLTFLRYIGSRDYFEDSFFIIPGCWDKWSGEHIGHITEIIHWRFCGGFFMGDAASIQRFHYLYLEHFPLFLQEHHKLVWEVNFWAWLESKTNWLSVYENNPGHHTWYKADHNDSIISSLWARIFSKRLMDNAKVTTHMYNYPIIEGYNPSSAAYLFHKGKHWLNTRYVNYWYYPDGWYMFYDGTRIIRTKNVLSELNFQSENVDQDGQASPGSLGLLCPGQAMLADDTADSSPILTPNNYVEISETIDLQKYDMYSRGIEDIRLYSVRDQMKYIATTVGYHSTGGNRMIVGNYQSDTHDLAVSSLIEPPTDTFLEKNWVPLVLNNPLSEFHGRELFIYGWGPFSVGEIHNDSVSGIKKLEIIYQENKTRLAPFFHKMKGSAIFVDTAELKDGSPNVTTYFDRNNLIGVVHFSEELRPRHYFHMLVELDRRTLRPLRYSEPFYFDSVSIEFCIGFSISLHTGEYLFWISRMDRDPMLVTIPIIDIPFTGSF
jgi:hypothetical protein